MNFKYKPNWVYLGNAANNSGITGVELFRLYDPRDDPELDLLSNPEDEPKTNIYLILNKNPGDDPPFVSGTQAVKKQKVLSMLGRRVLWMDPKTRIVPLECVVAEIKDRVGV